MIIWPIMLIARYEKLRIYEWLDSDKATSFIERIYLICNAMINAAIVNRRLHNSRKHVPGELEF